MSVTPKQRLVAFHTTECLEHLIQDMPNAALEHLEKAVALTGYSRVLTVALPLILESEDRFWK